MRWAGPLNDFSYDLQNVFIYCPKRVDFYPLFDPLFSFCPKGFSVLPHLREHENIHKDTRPHKCQYCEKRFNALASKTSHELTVHGDKQGKKQHKCR